jgi:tetratricopeptide (TPR) repeat protein
MVLAPDHPLVIEMINNAQMHEEEVKFNRDLKAKEDAAMQKGFAHFRKANDVYASGNLAQAIAEFEKYINASYPRNAEKKGEARRKLASIKQELKGKVGKLLDECKALGSKNKYKDAYISCNAAVQGDPKATDAKAMRDKMLKELRKEMKAIYEDSVLEESLGNVESAKEKWKKIMSEDLDFDDYSIKAKSKLQKYGAGG